MFGDEAGDRPTDDGWTDPTSRKERIKAALARAERAAAAEATGDDDRVAGWAERIDRAQTHVKGERAKASNAMTPTTRRRPAPNATARPAHAATAPTARTTTRS